MHKTDQLCHILSLCVCLPDITNQWMLQFLLFQQIGQVLPHTQRITLEILFHYHIEYGQTDGTRHWVTAKLRNLKPTRTEEKSTLRLGSPHPIGCLIIRTAEP